MPGIAEEGEGTKEPEVSSDFIDMGTAEVEILRCTFVSASADNSTRSKKIAPNQSSPHFFSALGRARLDAQMSIMWLGRRYQRRHAHAAE